MSPLAPAIGQTDYSAGMCRNARHLIPRTGAHLLQNCLLNAEDGSPFRRGGTVRKSNTDVGSTGLRFLWDGILAGGARSVFASATVNQAGVLAADDATPVINPLGPALTTPVRPAVIDGMLFFGGYAFGGSRKATDYGIHTATFTNGSTQVIGSGTAFVANVDAGSVINAPNQGLYAVKSVDDDTTITLFRPYTGTTVTSTAHFGCTEALPPALSGSGKYLGLQATSKFAVVANRLCIITGDTIRFSASGDSTAWDATDSHQIPGVTILGGASLGDELFAFTTDGLWGLGNMAYDETDAFGNPQHSQRQLNADMILWHEAGIATWENSLVIPALDGVWLMAPNGSPQKISRSIDPLLASYVQAGYQPGGASVYENHYFLPIIDSSAVVHDVLVCRLDRPTRTSLGTVFGWTTWAGSGANVCAFASREPRAAGSAPALLGAEKGTHGRVLTMPALTLDGAATDHDGAAIAFQVEGRDYSTGSGENLVKKLRVWYELVDAAGTATMQAYIGDGAAFTLLAGVNGDGPVLGEGASPHVWRVGKRLRYARPAVQCISSATRVVLRGMDLVVRPSGRL